jgi:hypothetical protein
VPLHAVLPRRILYSKSGQAAFSGDFREKPHPAQEKTLEKNSAGNYSNRK